MNLTAVAITALICATVIIICLFGTKQKKG